MENLTAEQSIELITRMIRTAESNVKRNSFFFLLWGWVVVAANLGMYILQKVDYPYPFIVWSITIPAWVFSMYKGYKMGRSKQVTTHFDRVTASLWITFGICIFTIVAFGFKINYQLGPLVLLVAAIPTLVSGVLLKFKPLILGGVLFWLFGILNFLLPYEWQPLIGALAITCGYLIPGYLLKNKRD